MDTIVWVTLGALVCAMVYYWAEAMRNAAIARTFSKDAARFYKVVVLIQEQTPDSKFIHQDAVGKFIDKKYDEYISRRNALPGATAK